MKEEEIIVNFTYKNLEKSLICKPEEQIIEVLKSFSLENNVNFRSVRFLIKGQRLIKSDYYLPINNFISSKNKGFLSISVVDIIKNINNDKIIKTTDDVKKTENNNISNNNDIPINIIEPPIVDKYKFNCLKDNNIVDTDNIAPKTDKELIKEDKKVQNVFIFKSCVTEIQCSLKDNTFDTFKAFAKDNGENLDSLSFFYKERKIDHLKTFEEIVDTKDVNEGRIEII